MKNVIYLLFLFLNTAMLFGQWSSDPAVNTRVTHGGLLPQMISDGSGGAFIVYQDSPALLRQIWVQRLDRYGYVRFPDNGIRVSSEERNQTPYYFLVSDSAGGVIIVFVDFQKREGKTFSAIYAQRIDSSGAKYWPEAGIEVSPPAEAKAPVSACSDGQSGVFVFWSEDADSNGVFELRAQRVSAEGELLWTQEGITITNEFTSFNWPMPATAVSSLSSSAIVLYSDSTGTKHQRVSAEGELL